MADIMNPIEALKYKNKSIDDFVFDSLWIPPMQCYLTPQDVEALRKIATSLRLSGKIQVKYKMIDDIMRARGFRRFSRGTNRVVYSFLEDTRFVVKIALDKVGMQDNPREFENQKFLQPFVTKMFYVSPCGTVGFAERVKPIANIEEFKEIAEDVFYMLVCKILGEYVVEDCGNKYFKNYGIRPGCGPVLLDYPYVYKLDGNKLICNNKLDNGTKCGGEIGYDDGINFLYCNKCGKKYLASDLKDNSIINNLIIDKGGNKMKVCIMKGNRILASNDCNVDDVIEKRRPKKNEHSKLKVSISTASNSNSSNTIDDYRAVNRYEKTDFRGFEVDPESTLSVSISIAEKSYEKYEKLNIDPDSTLKVSISNNEEPEVVEEESTVVEPEPVVENSKGEELKPVEESTVVEPEPVVENSKGEELKPVEEPEVVEETTDVQEEVAEAEEATKEDPAEVENTEKETNDVEEESASEPVEEEQVEEKVVDTVEEEKKEEKPAKVVKKKADPKSKTSIKKATKAAAKVEESEIDENDYNDIVEKANKTITRRTKTRKTIKKMIEDEEFEDDMKKVKSKKTTKTKKAASKTKSNYIPSKE